MKFGQLIEYININILLHKSSKKCGRDTSSRPLFVFWKSFIWVKTKCSAAWFQYISIALNLVYIENKHLKNLGHRSRDILNFGFSEKDLEYDFSRKLFLMSYSINWTNFVVWLPLILEILGNVYIAIVCFPGYDIINFEIIFIFLIKPFSYMQKNWRQKFKYLENEKSS